MSNRYIVLGFFDVVITVSVFFIIFHPSTDDSSILVAKMK